MLSLFLCSSDFIMPQLHGSNARSPIWNHYEKLEEKEDGSWTVKCIHCGRVAYYHSHYNGTASLRNHVKRCFWKQETRIVNSQELITSYYFVYLNVKY